MASIFGEIEKLITEHGCASILRERLGLAADQYTALERKNVELQAENNKLREEIKSLHAQNAELRKSIPREADTPRGFDNDTHRILSLFFRLSDGAFVDQIAQQAGLDRPMVEYHCDLLRAATFIRQTRAISGSSPCIYGITSEGRKYVVRNRIQ